MASEGPNNPGTMANDNAVGTYAWTNPDRAKVSDDSKAQANGGFPGGISNYLKATNFGFSIPSGATIDGIKVEIEKFKGAGGVKDEFVKIVKSDGSIGTENKGTTGTQWPGSDTYITHGADNDLWSESWSDTDINDVDFGVVVAVDETGLCLHENTIISIVNSEDKMIKDIKVGDFVYSFNTETHQIIQDKVTAVKHRKISNSGNKYYYISYKGGIIKATYNHQFYINNKKWTSAKELKIGDELRNLTGNYNIKITKIEIIENFDDDVWDISVEKNHTFFANNILVHNQGSSALVDHIRITVTYTPEAPAGFTRKIKIAGTFQDKPIKTKVSGTFEDKPIKIKVGGTFQDA